MARWSLSVLILVLIWVAIVPTLGERTAAVQTVFSNIQSYRVDGAPNYAAPGNESFWNRIAWTNVSLAASVSPGGGQTSSLLVKTANDGFGVYVLLRWRDDQGPSYGSSAEEYKNGTRLVFLDPAHTGGVNRLVYNDTYYYPDRVAMLWFVANPSTLQTSPRMLLNTTGAFTGGAADIWHWQSNPTDNSPKDTGFPGGYTAPSGKPIYPENNVSFAEDDYTNMTGYFPIAGTVGGAQNLDPYADPFIVHVGTNFSNANKTWTVEMVRSFTVSEAAQYRVQLSTGSNYYVAFAVWNGKMGESAHIKSVSQWYTFTVTNITPGLPPSSSSAALGVSTTLAFSVGAGLLVVGLIVGMVLRPKQNAPKLVKQ